MSSRGDPTESEPSGAVVVEILQRLWQTKLNSIALLESWRTETKDAEIQAGLAGQIIDERRHATMIGEQIRRLGGRIGGNATKDAASRVFSEATADREDVRRLFAIYRGVKAYTVNRCSHLMPYVDVALAQTLDHLTRDEERHIRWADMRLQRLLTHDRMRECNLLLNRVWAGLEVAWGRQWRQLPFLNNRRRAA
jgi:hypothetical protein